MLPMRARSIPLLTIVAALLIVAPSAAANCIKPHSVPIASGVSPSGSPWEVEGSIRNNGNSCREWLFGMDFELTGATNWSWGTGIPVGGHLRGEFEVEASDNLQEDGTTRVFSGSVGGEVAKVMATLSNNRHLTFQPKAPSTQLRRKFTWLRNVRYFVTYYPPEAFVTGVSTFSASGQLLYRDRSFEGL
jgi:hypothetical protein